MLKNKLKMRDISRKSTKEVMQQAEELINTSNLENKFTDNIFPLRDSILEKIPRVVEDIFLRKF